MEMSWLSFGKMIAILIAIMAIFRMCNILQTLQNIETPVQFALD